MLRPRGLHAFWPLARVGGERLLQRTLVDAPMPELPLDRDRAPAALGPDSREGRGEADIIGKTAGRKLDRDLRGKRRIEALVGETAGELGDAVLAPGEQRERPPSDLRPCLAQALASSSAAASAGGLAMSRERRAASISAATALCSFRYSRALSLPWPMRSPL